MGSIFVAGCKFCNRYDYLSSVQCNIYFNVLDTCEDLFERSQRRELQVLSSKLDIDRYRNLIGIFILIIENHFPFQIFDCSCLIL
jgi:hypothetical protein